jgi:hypothetical protein
VATITAKNLIDKAATLLFDVTNIKWSRAEWLGWFNTGQRAIVILHPNSNNTVAVVKLVAGARQSIPSHGWLLLDMLRNMGTTGTVPGRAIRIVSRKLLDAFNPNWNSDTASSVVRNYWFDMQDQTAFFVYPPNDGTGYIELNYSNVPTDATDETLVMTIPDSYEQALLDYMLFRACSKAVDVNQAAALAPSYLASFNAYMGSKLSSEQANNPNFGLMPMDTSNLGGVS